jgi:hypothetical protein
VRRPAAAALVAIVSLGCGSSESLFPMEVGKQWSYTVQTGFPTFVQKMTVKRPISIAGVQGYEIEGPMGTCRVAWSGDRLIAARMANTEFFPPITILRAGEAAASRAWKGRVRLADGTAISCSAEQTQAADTLTVRSKPVKTVKSTVLLQLPGRVVDLSTWYEPGRGPVRQIERVNGVQIVAASGL